MARERKDALDDFVDALELLDELLDELASRDSAPYPGPASRQRERMRVKLERVAVEMQRHAAELEATELERERERERERIRRVERQAAIDACEHDWQPLEGLIEQCSKCHSWRNVPQVSHG